MNDRGAIAFRRKLDQLTVGRCLAMLTVGNLHLPQLVFLVRCSRTHFFAAADDEELKVPALYGGSSNAAIPRSRRGTCYA